MNTLPILSSHFIHKFDYNEEESQAFANWFNNIRNTYPVSRKVRTNGLFNLMKLKEKSHE